MRHLFILFFSLVYSFSWGQGLNTSNGAILLLKVDSLGNVLGSRTVESISHSYGYAIEKHQDSILVFCYTKGIIEIDSLTYMPDSTDNSTKMVRLVFDDSLLYCLELSQSTPVTVGHVSGTSGFQTYLVSTIADTFKSNGQSIPNVGNTDIQISLIEGNNTKWTIIYGTPFMDVPYAIYFDSTERTYYVTGFCELPDSSTNNFQARVIPKEYWTTNSERFYTGNQDSISKEIETNKEETSQYQVYPNPFTDQLNILASEGNHKGTVSYRMMAANGITIGEGEIKDRITVLSGFENLASGVYYIEILGPDNIRLTFTVIRN